jgi:hypothetical protein
MSKTYLRDPSKTEKSNNDNALAAGIAKGLDTDAGITSKTLTDTQLGVGTSTIKYRNPLDLVAKFDRATRLAAYRGLASAFQFTLINTADWIVRKRESTIPTEPTLDERNTQDEFARFSTAENIDGDSQETKLAEELGFEKPMDPQEKLKLYGRLYYGMVQLIVPLRPNEYERPKALVDALRDYRPRGAAIDADTAANDRKALVMQERKPGIAELLADLKGHPGDLDEVLSLPLHTQLRNAISMWKGIYFRRKGLVSFIVQSGKTDDLAQVKLMQEDLARLERWCLEFEKENSTVFEVMDEAGITVVTIDDAKRDVKRPRN